MMISKMNGKLSEHLIVDLLGSSNSIQCKNLLKQNLGYFDLFDIHYVKGVRIRSYSGPYFPAFASV